MGKSKRGRKAGFTSYDFFFGHPMRINYNGRDNYGTICGALMSLVVILFLLAFVALSIKLIFFRYLGISKSATGLQDSVISTVTTYD